MPEPGALTARASEASQIISRLTKEKKRILVVTHIDADGLSSGSIAFHALLRRSDRLRPRRSRTWT